MSDGAIDELRWQAANHNHNFVSRDKDLCNGFWVRMHSESALRNLNLIVKEKHEEEAIES